MPPVNTTRFTLRGYSSAAVSYTHLDVYRAIAQLGERLHGMQEVSGSIPLSSTKFCTQRIWFVKKSCGAIAQLGERLHGMQEVSGSIPLSSTKIQNPRFGGGFCF